MARKKGSKSNNINVNVNMKSLDPDFCPFCGGVVDYYSVGLGDGMAGGCRNDNCPIKPQTYAYVSPSMIKRDWRQIYKQVPRLVEAINRVK